MAKKRKPKMFSLPDREAEVKAHELVMLSDISSTAKAVFVVLLREGSDIESHALTLDQIATLARVSRITAHRGIEQLFGIGALKPILDPKLCPRGRTRPKYYEVPLKDLAKKHAAIKARWKQSRDQWEQERSQRRGGRLLDGSQDLLGKSSSRSSSRLQITDGRRRDLAYVTSRRTRRTRSQADASRRWREFRQKARPLSYADTNRRRLGQRSRRRRALAGPCGSRRSVE